MPPSQPSAAQFLSSVRQALFSRSSRRGLNSWTIASGAISLLIATPILFVLMNLLVPEQAVWAHLAATVLPRYLLNSLWLMLGVGFGVTVIGVSTAWLVVSCRFWGSSLLESALLLPLAIPAYVLAYAYTDWLDVSGPVQSAIRNWFAWDVGSYWFPDIRSVWGAITLLTLVLYPYVYLLARVVFLEQSGAALEASRCLGCGPWQSFSRVALPLARPAIMAGLALALMETLNDFGTVQFFGVETFTTGIYRTWLGMGNRTAATQLAAVLLLFILILVAVERWSRGRAGYYSNTRRSPIRYDLSGLQAVIAQLVCVLPIIFGFLLPVILLLRLAIEQADLGLDARFWQAAANSLLVAGLTAGLAVVIAVGLAYGLRLHPNSRFIRITSRIAAMGYAIPGSVIAVGVLIPMSWLDNHLATWAKATLGLSTGLLLTGTITALIYAYLVRFLAVSLGTVEASLTQIKPSLDDASRSLGQSPLGTVLKVHTPLIWGGIVSSAILVFVDVMKELPATLVMRPFNFDTLAVQVYRLASDERLAEAATPALALIAVGMFPVMLLSWRVAKSHSSRFSL